MITTRQINVDLAKEKLKLRGVTTKDIDAGVRVEPPKAPIKPRGVSTTTLADVADIAEKKRRDDIMAERKAALIKSDKEKKLAMKDEKKIVINEKGEANKAFKKGDAVYQKEEKEEKEKGPKLVEPSKGLMAELTKKPWNKMNAKERKEYQIEKTRKEKDEGKDKKD